MALDPVTAIGDAVANVAAALTPIINDTESQKYLKSYEASITQYNEIMATSPFDPNALNTYLMQLASNSGTAIGSLGNTYRDVPVGYFDFLIERANLCNFYSQTIASLQASKNSQSNS